MSSTRISSARVVCQSGRRTCRPFLWKTPSAISMRCGASLCSAMVCPRCPCRAFGVRWTHWAGLTSGWAFSQHRPAHKPQRVTSWKFRVFTRPEWRSSMKLASLRYVPLSRFIATCGLVLPQRDWQRKYGYAPKGRKVIVRRFYGRTKRHNVVGSYLSSGYFPQTFCFSCYDCSRRSVIWAVQRRVRRWPHALVRPSQTGRLCSLLILLSDLCLLVGSCYAEAWIRRPRHGQPGRAQTRSCIGTPLV